MDVHAPRPADRAWTVRTKSTDAWSPAGLDVVPFADQAEPNDVMVQRETGFTIHLPPRRL